MQNTKHILVPINKKTQIIIQHKIGQKQPQAQQHQKQIVKANQLKKTKDLPIVLQPLKQQIKDHKVPLQ